METLIGSDGELTGTSSGIDPVWAPELDLAAEMASCRAVSSSSMSRPVFICSSPTSSRCSVSPVAFSASVFASSFVIALEVLSTPGASLAFFFVFLIWATCHVVSCQPNGGERKVSYFLLRSGKLLCPFLVFFFSHTDMCISRKVPGCLRKYTIQREIQSEMQQSCSQSPTLTMPRPPGKGHSRHHFLAREEK